jgi:transposase
VLDVILTILPASLSQAATPFARGVAQADRNEGRREEAAPGLTAFERDELTRLRRDNKQLRLERDIL